MTSQLMTQSHMIEFPRRGKKPLAALCPKSSKGGINSESFYEIANTFEWYRFEMIYRNGAKRAANLKDVNVKI